MGYKKEVVYKEQLTYLLLAILAIANNEVEISETFNEDYRKRLKFQKTTDWKRYRASIDLFADTEYAIMNAFKYQLGYLGKKNRDFGEKYLRLYGILNAVYLQFNALKELSKLLNYPDNKNVMKVFEELDIYKLRGIAGSHTVDYMYDQNTLQNKPGINKTTSFRIIQMYMEETGNNITALDENNIIYEFNLLRVLSDYEKEATKLLINLILHMIKTLVYKKEDKVTLKKRLDDLLPNLIDYSKIDKNKEYKIRKKKKIEKLLSQAIAYSSNNKN